MNIILSPAKKMRRDPDSLPPWTAPVFLEQAREIRSCLRSLSPQQLQALWGCNDAIARQNQQRLASMELEVCTTPAILSYDGIAFQHMAPSVFTDGAFAYVQAHLRILSGFYGVLRPMDGVQPYRLEMQARLHIGDKANLYDFWGDRLYHQVWDTDRTLVNLASREYSKCITPYLTGEDRVITCEFLKPVKGKLIQQATFAKMARGEMVRYLAEQQAVQPEQLQDFSQLGFHFSPERSREDCYVFVQEEAANS